MGMKGTEIVEKAGLDVEELIKRLNKAYSDEWLSYYQYWVGAKVAEGPVAAPLTPEMEEHAREECEHAAKLAKRIEELGGTPVLSPEEWYKETNCGYLVPSDPDAAVLLKQNLESERCAIEVYNDLLEFIGDKDPITQHVVREILQDEIEHETELEDIGRNMLGCVPKDGPCKCKRK